MLRKEPTTKVRRDQPIMRKASNQSREIILPLQREVQTKFELVKKQTLKMIDSILVRVPNRKFYDQKEFIRRFWNCPGRRWTKSALPLLVTWVEIGNFSTVTKFPSTTYYFNRFIGRSVDYMKLSGNEN